MSTVISSRAGGARYWLRDPWAHLRPPAPLLAPRGAFKTLRPALLACTAHTRPFAVTDE